MRLSRVDLRRLLRLAIAASALLGALAVRVVVSARAELNRAESLYAEGEVDASIVHFRRAARWYAPGSPYHRRALGRLMAIGGNSERQGGTERALAAYRAVRSAIMSTRSFYTPESEMLERADRRIAALMASLPAPGIDAGKSRAELGAEHLALLRAETGPDPFWTCVLLLGFLAWVGGAFAFTFRAIDDEHRFVRKPALRCALVIASGFALFVLGMALA
jgi:hypothetical protein